ncbi:heavy-metal-associated domain-containing protein [Blautia liquoris]|uniref:Heavy-metal-associated domain-containing protein n=1 Tax=Blautia liquoris TaxID=2779518 RepID=A0A7M2RM25_9FIRM|nr:heavy metal-associated domain-containing protein [Blautia liquoris]QOV20412.1 heavy-metal-associated domain-containing protein [Blautia liquoris]
MATALICLVLIVIAVFGIRSYRKKLTSGCCSPSDDTAVKKTKIKDKNISHYPYHKVLKVDGMTCENCANRVENSLNQLGNVYARVDLSSESADVYMKQDIDESRLRETVNNAGYRVYQVINNP